jgi:hypothetical protein
LDIRDSLTARLAERNLRIDRGRENTLGSRADAGYLPASGFVSIMRLAGFHVASRPVTFGNKRPGVNSND